MLLGVDAGGTSTRAVLVDGEGRCVGYGAAGGGNPVSWGPERATEQIVAAVSGAIRDAGHVGPIGGAALAMAGGSAFSATDTLTRALTPVGVTGPVEVVSDLLATFCSGTAELDGYALVAGTGASAVRVRAGGVELSADGLGWLLGDEGSGFWIGHRAVTAALAALDGRGPATSLVPMVLAELGVAGRTGQDASGRPAALQASVDVLYRWRPVELSRFAAAVFRAAGLGDGAAGDAARGAVTGGAVAGDGSGSAAPAAGQAAGTGIPAAPDAVALAILGRARDLLVDSVRAVRSDDVTGPVVLGGGIARRLPGLVEALADVTGASEGSTPRVVTVTDGTVGAGVLVLRRAGITVDLDVFERLVSSVARRR